MLATKTLIDADVLLELTREKIDINSLVDELAARHVFDDEDEASVIRAWRKVQVRRAIKSLKDDEGFPLIFSVVDIDEMGREVRKYKQELLFNIEDYRQAIESCTRQESHWRKVKRHLIGNAREKFGAQTKLFG